MVCLVALCLVRAAVGLITPRFGMSPAASGVNTPRGGGGVAGGGGLTQMSINHAFGGESVKIDS